MSLGEKHIQADETIKNHVLISLGAGLVPIPVLDVVAVSAVQLDMLKQLARLYDIEFSEDSGKSYVSAIVSSSLARYAASFVKAIPGIGTILGGVSMSVLSGASTYGLGQVFKKHFSEGGNLLDINLDRAQQIFKEEFEKGKKVASRMAKEKKTDTNEDADTTDEIMDKLEKLAGLKEKGIITEEDYNEQKKRLLNSV